MQLMGRSQAVRQRVLIPSFARSIRAALAKLRRRWFGLSRKERDEIMKNITPYVPFENPVELHVAYGVKQIGPGVIIDGH